MRGHSIDHRALYRLPWTLPDNAISWLEPTAECNLACDGCYRENDKNSHKPLEEVLKEIDLFQRLRKFDCMSIAGGEPLLYPHILELVRHVKSRGLKPIVNTNGELLTPELLRELKKAGVFGFTIHVDSMQGRTGKWKGKNELELNELRYHYARMIADAGNISCSFNATVYEENLQFVPDMIEWGHKHIDIVQTMVFICFRNVFPEMPFDWYAGRNKVALDELVYRSESKRMVEIKTTDLFNVAKKRFPQFEPAAYLNGTAEPDSIKWMLSDCIGNRDRIHGYAGPKFMELVMAGYHFGKGRYLSYASRRTMRLGRSAMLFLWPFDRLLRQSLVRYLKYLLGNPLRVFRRAHIQSIMFIQPIDFKKDGAQNMCDSCPDMTVHEGKLVWSCRLEEIKKYGTYVSTLPKNQ